MTPVPEEIADADRWRLPRYLDLAGKVAVVTGGSGGIGAATCRLLVSDSAAWLTGSPWTWPAAMS